MFFVLFAPPKNMILLVGPLGAGKLTFCQTIMENKVPIR